MVNCPDGGPTVTVTEPVEVACAKDASAVEASDVIFVHTNDTPPPDPLSTMPSATPPLGMDMVLLSDEL